MGMIKATGASIIVKLLEAEGIDIVAGIPGGSILPLYDELTRSRIRHILVRQEQAAGFIAQGIARSTEKVAVCMATSGPGAMNLLTAIADSRCDSVPIVAITGQVNTSLIGTDAFQEADTFGLSFPITKHSILVKNARDLLKAIPLAFAIAKDGRPGPVLLDIPRDVQTQTVIFDAWPDIANVQADYNAARLCKNQHKDDTVLVQIAQQLLRAKKPVLYAGGGCNSVAMSKALASFLEAYQCPVAVSLMGLGAVRNSYAGHCGMVGMHGSTCANRAMHDADVVLALGVRFDDRATGLIKAFCPNATVLHIDVDAAEINKIIPAAYSLVGKGEELLPLVTEKVRELQKSGAADFALSDERAAWYNTLCAQKKAEDTLLLGRLSSVPKESLNPRAFIQQIPREAEKAGVAAEHIIVTTDVGQHQMWAAQYYPVERPCHFLTSGSLGTMGFGLPAAIGAALANPTKRVVCISGDGSILMNIQELITLCEHNLDVTIFVFQNGTLGMVRQQQHYLFDSHYSASEFEKQPDFLTIAAGFGIDAVDASEKNWAERAFSKGPHLVRVLIDKDENVLPFVAAGHANIDAIS